jgi:hypothetical protein
MQLIIDVHNSGETPFVVYGNDSTDIRLSVSVKNSTAKHSHATMPPGCDTRV